MKRVAGKWREIGVALKFDDALLDAIEKFNSTGGPVSCLTQLLIRWFKRAPPKYRLPTLEELLKALRNDTVEEHRVAYDLEQEFTGKTCTVRVCIAPVITIIICNYY